MVFTGVLVVAPDNLQNETIIITFITFLFVSLQVRYFIGVCAFLLDTFLLFLIKCENNAHPTQVALMFLLVFMVFFFFVEK